MRRTALALIAAVLLAACDFTAAVAIKPQCLNDRIPYSAMPDTITLIHCSTVDSLVRRRDTTRTP